MNIAGLFLAFVINALVVGVFLWLGMKAVAIYQGMGKGADYCSYSNLVIAAAASSLVSLIPSFGWVLSIIVLLGLMMKFAEASFMEVLVMVGVAKVCALLVTFMLIPVI